MVESRPGDVFQPGDLLNNTYRIESLLGRGGTSDVYRARNEISGRLVALKALKSEFSGNEDYLALLKREEEIRDIRHDAVVRYSENHRTRDGLVYLVMDYVEGPGLDKLMKDGGLKADDLMTICRRVTQGLQSAHNRNIVHRDLSPDNIILRDGDPSQAVIIDFGIAKDTNPGAETIVGNEFAGKYAYAAPEQFSGNTDARSDIYSLGALLLAVYRGAAPNIGKNPMEVVQQKSKPLDTFGVPEPLKALIDRMSNPDPDKRLQTAGAVLQQIDPDLDSTVIAPVSRPVIVPPASKPSQPRATSASPAKEKKRRGPITAIFVVLLLSVAGGAGYFGGFFDGVLGPKYPVADPYTLIVSKPENGPPHAVGFVPTPETMAAIEQKMAGLLGTSELNLATGDISESWGEDILSVLETLVAVDEWRFVVSGNRAQITGMTLDRSVRIAASNAFGTGLPGALTGNANIVLGPVLVTSAMLLPLLEEHADCGRLTLIDAPTIGYGLDSIISVGGRLAKSSSRIALFDAIRDISGDRDIVVDTEILNPTLCLIEAYLPRAPESEINVVYGFGDKTEANPTGRYFVGENPVIDVWLPASVDSGYISVSVLDVSGDVFHLLPNLNRSENSVSVLRGGKLGPFMVRVAFSLQEAVNTRKIAFVVDDNSLGKSKIVVIHSADPLFERLRPTTESAAGYAQALKDRAEQSSALIYSLDTSILTTARP